MEDKFYWKTITSTVIMLGIMLIMVWGTAQAISNIENDKDIWFHVDNKWKTCSCSTELPEYFNLCQDFMESCLSTTNLTTVLQSK